MFVFKAKQLAHSWLRNYCCNENKIISEIKIVEQLKGRLEAQLLTYMKLANIEQDFLIYFNRAISAK